jgi:hypothetical protein
MLTRAWFLFSLGWAALFFWNYSTRAQPSLDRFDAFVALLPLASGVVMRVAYRYVRYGPRRR